jgi:formyltetrahydrofolate-dependent phosphoribosylglycinamide formyltransferase
MTAPVTKPLNVVVLISGGGTTLRNLLEHIERRGLPMRVTCVISSNAKARGLKYARARDIATAVLERKAFASDAEYGAAVFDEIRRHECDYVVMAGFLKFVPIPSDFDWRVLNIHPGLIPAFCGHGMYGHHVHEAVLAYGAKLSGCTVHFVDNEYDHGPIILQRAVPVLDGDTPDLLAARVFEAECEAYPEALRLLAEGRIRHDGRLVRVLQAGT